MDENCGWGKYTQIVTYQNLIQKPTMTTSSQREMIDIWKYGIEPRCEETYWWLHDTGVESSQGTKQYPLYFYLPPSDRKAKELLSLNRN
jgi:hypothetical protein